MSSPSTAPSSTANGKRKPPTARFLQGSILKHVITMTSATTVGLTSIFFVDLADMYFISLLGEEALAASVGLAASVLYFLLSISIGLSIGLGATVAREVGQGDHEKAERTIFNGLLLNFVVMGLLALPVYFFADQFLIWVGAEGATLSFGLRYLKIVVLSLPILSLGMSMGAVLRSLGAARASMITTVLAGASNAILDPFLIFTLEMHLEGAATATVIARVIMVAISLYYLRHHLESMKPRGGFGQDLRAISKIAVPAALTNLATPFANAYVIAAIAAHGAEALAGMAIISRITPFAFAAVFAVSAAVGPIIGQNMGAEYFPRVRQTLKSSLLVIGVVVASMSALLALFSSWLTVLFGLSGESAALLIFFCLAISWTFVFNGAQFIANAAFNNMQRATWSTASNWGKATLGTIPFVLAGDYLGGAQGILAGYALGAVFFGLGSFFVAYRVVDVPHKGIGLHYLGAWLPAVMTQFGWQRFMETRWRAEHGNEDDRE